MSSFVSPPAPLSQLGHPLSLLTVHAHPDDESSKGAGTLARYSDEGVTTTLVCCTGGELGDIANPAMDLPEVKANLAQVRSDELDRATKVIGFSEVVMLGYRDSGMAGSEGNEDPASFHRADRAEAAGRLARIIRRTRPQVVITYADDQQGYPHPDHLAVHDITAPALVMAADPAFDPAGDAPWEVSKLYYSAWARARMLAHHQAFLDREMQSPFDARWFERPASDHRITTRIDVAQWYARRCDALRAHATQIDPTSPFWFGLPDDVAAGIYPYEDFILASSTVGDPDLGAVTEGELCEFHEDDLFAGVRPSTTESHIV